MAAIRTLTLLALPFLAGAAFAQAAPKPAPLPAIPGVSAAGIAVLNKQRAAPDTQFQAIIRQVRDVSSQLQLEAQRPVVDVEKINGLMKRRSVLLAQSQTRQDDRLVAALRALPPGDRGPFLRALATPAR